MASILATVGTTTRDRWLVDPYELFRVVRIDGFNAIKSQAGQMQPVFNLALPGAGVHSARREGYQAVFRQRNQENTRSYVRGSKSIYFADCQPAPEFRAVEHMIDIAARSGVQLKFIVYPVHAQTLVLLHQAGLWPAFESWKRKLVIRVDGAPAGASVELWDFSGFGPYADEGVPAPGDTTTEMHWYWEAGHFRKPLGEVMLATIFTASENQPVWGRRLSPDILDEHLRQLRTVREFFETSHPLYTAELEGLISTSR